MNFEAKSNKVGITVSSSMPSDNYSNYLGKFLEEVRSIIPNDQLLIIIKPLLGLKSWRLLNREMRRACDQYCTDNALMSHRDYQAKFFYEGTMIGRTTYGKDAPWVSVTATIEKPKEKKTIPTNTIKVPVTANIKNAVHTNSNPKMDDEWDRINQPIARRILEGELEEAQEN